MAIPTPICGLTTVWTWTDLLVDKMFVEPAVVI